MKFSLLLLICLGLTGCSGSKSAQKVSEETPQIELSDADEFVENPVEGSTETADAGEAIEMSEPATETAEAPIEEPTAIADTATDAPAETPAEEDISLADNASPDFATPAVNTTAGFEPGTPKTYTVQKNETLMLIAFKLYGDYEKWKELANYNKDALRGSTQLKAGMTLSYLAPAEEFIWNPQGLPYLIRTGDSLSGISKTVYNNVKKWKLLWDNNRPLIKDPNKIYAGFTIYYIENGREVAAEI